MNDREPFCITSTAVLFDPEALAELLAEEPDPARAFCRFPRRLDGQIRRANAYRLPGRFDEANLLIGEAAARHPVHPGAEEPARLLRVPSGRICAAEPSYPTPSTDADLTSPVAEVPPGLYRVRAFRCRTRYDADICGRARKRLSAEDQAILGSTGLFGRLNLVAMAAAAVGVILLRVVLAPLVDESSSSGIHTELAFLIAWPELFLLARWVIRRFHPGIRAARRRLVEEEKRLGEEVDRHWNDHPSAVLLERVSDDPGDPGTKGWPEVG